MPNSALGLLEHLQLVCCCTDQLHNLKFQYHQLCNLKGLKVSIQEGQNCTYAVMPMLVAPKLAWQTFKAGAPVSFLSTPKQMTHTTNLLWNRSTNKYKWPRNLGRIQRLGVGVRHNSWWMLHAYFSMNYLHRPLAL